MTTPDVLQRIRDLVEANRFNFGPHVYDHCEHEDFGRNLVRDAATGKICIVEEYPEEARALILGHITLGKATRCPLHILCHLRADWVTLVTAYIPQPPEWLDPFRRGETR